MSLRGNGRRRAAIVLSSLLSCSIVLVVPSLAAANATKVQGVVTNAIHGPEFGEPVAHIKVTAYEASTGKPLSPEVDAETGPIGTYELTLPKGGEYLIGFKTAIEHPADFAPQYFSDQTRLAKATRILAPEGSTTSAVNAQLTQGASISGTVTDAATHQPIAGLGVFAVSSTETEQFAIALTNASGNYTVEGLGSGTDLVAFVSEGSTEKPGTYMSQVFSGQPLLEGSLALEELPLLGTPVTVTAPDTTPGIDASMVRNEAVGTSPPVVSGTPAVGQTLSCAPGTWTGLGPPTDTYQWLRDGGAIAGATADAYAVQAADQGHVLSCKVTATNKLGSASALSNALTVPAPVVADLNPVVPKLTLLSTRIAVSGAVARVAIACADEACSGSIELTVQTLAKVHVGHKLVSKRETLDLGKSSYSLAAGHSTTLVIHLTGVGRHLLGRASHHRLSADALVLLDGARSVKAVTLGESAPNHK